MATINLGSIKFNWKGAYAGGTAYAVDDVVSYNGSSYVCILASTGNAVSNGTYWQVMAEGGDVATTITTQGDILYRDGSGLQRLGAGTSGNVLTTKGSGQNPVWEPAVGGKIGQVVVVTKTDTTSTGSTTFTDITGLSATITPSATSSKILWSYDLNVGSSTQYAKIKIVYGTNSDLTTQAIGDTSGSRISSSNNAVHSAGTDKGQFPSMSGIDNPNTTSATTYKLRWSVPSGTIYLNRVSNDPDNNEISRGISTLTLMEVLA